MESALPFPRGFFRQIGLSPIHTYKIKHRKIIPTPAVALRIYKALGGKVKFLDILNNQELVEISQIICSELQGKKPRKGKKQ